VRGSGLYYGICTVSLGSRLVHCLVVAFAIFDPPVISEKESQNTSTALPLIVVGGWPSTTEIVD
jgi:hypothetical protein